jgi:hypothetical protein
MIARVFFNTLSTAALALGWGLVLARAEPAPEMDHSKMNHGAAAPAAQWVDPGKAQGQAVAEAPKIEAPKAEAGKTDEHAGHHGGGGEGMGGMNHGGGGMSGGGMMGGMGGSMSGMMGGGMEHGGGGGGGMMGGMGAMMNKMMCGFADHIDGRLAYLKAELKLTDQQLSAWSNFDDAWRAVAQKAQAKCAAADDRPDSSKPPVLNKLSMMESHMANHLDIVRAQKAAIEPLLSALSDEQRKIANEVLTGVMKVGMPMMGGGGMGGGGMGGMMGGMSHGGSGGGMQH